MAEEKGWLPSLGHASLGTLAINGSRPTGQPSHATMPASPFASLCSGPASQLEMAHPRRNGRFYRGTSAACHHGSPAARRRGPNDDQDDGFTSAGTTSTARFKRLDSDFIFSTPLEAASSRPIAE